MKKFACMLLMLALVAGFAANAALAESLDSVVMLFDATEELQPREETTTDAVQEAMDLSTDLQANGKFLYGIALNGEGAVIYHPAAGSDVLYYWLLDASKMEYGPEFYIAAYAIVVATEDIESWYITPDSILVYSPDIGGVNQPENGIYGNLEAYQEAVQNAMLASLGA